ncbi:MAG: IclR family transcriptional regulator [Pseudomonadota bacterium]
MQVRQAANVIDLLEFFAARGHPATLAEIADGLEWPRSSTFNLVGTLVSKGYLYEPRYRGGYYPSPRWHSVAVTLAENDPLPDSVRQLADTIGRETGETTAIGSMSSQSIMFIHVRESRQPIRYNAEIGTTVPLHASSAGRAILSQMSLKEREAFYRKLSFEKYSDTTPMSVARIEDDLREAEKRGYHQSDSEYITDLVGVAMPLPLGSRRLSIVVAGPLSRCLKRRPMIAKTIIAAMQREGFPIELPSASAS